MSGRMQKTHSFPVDWDDDGDRKSGFVTIKRLTAGDMMRIAQMKTQLLGGYHCVRDDDGHVTGQGVDPIVEYRADIMATVEVAVIDKPEWLDVQKLPEDPLAPDSIARRIYDEVSRWHGTFRARGRDDAQSGGSANGSARIGEGNVPATDSLGRNAHVVDQALPSALDP
jgi:hypothetical protein